MPSLILCKRNGAGRWGESCFRKKGRDKRNGEIKQPKKWARLVANCRAQSG